MGNLNLLISDLLTAMSRQFVVTLYQPFSLMKQGASDEQGFYCVSSQITQEEYPIFASGVRTLTPHGTVLLSVWESMRVESAKCSYVYIPTLYTVCHQTGRARFGHNTVPEWRGLKKKKKTE